MPLYAFGSNGSGQLGVGHVNDLAQPELVKCSESWSVTQLAAGGNHTVILCSDGNVRATGNNEDNRALICGRSTSAFTEMSIWEYNRGGPVEVKQVACSWSATFLLLADGSVFVCGSGNSGELGLGEGVVGSRVMRRIPNFPPPGTQIECITSCMAHVVTVLSGGGVHGWGKGRKGQLGEQSKDVWEPRRVDGITEGIDKAVCGKDFTVVVGDQATGKMTIFGPNGNDRFGVQSRAPRLSPESKNMSASWGTVFILSGDGSMLAWGRDDHGQLPPPKLPEIASIAAGSEHVLALTKSGKVLAWGWGEHGNCGRPTDGRGDVKGHWNEINVPGRATKVFAGCATSFVEVEGSI